MTAVAVEGRTSSCGELRFLIAEDHAFQRHEWLRTLEGLGAKTVYQAEDGRCALTILRDPERPVDIVISDLDMDGMDGMEFVRHVGESGAPVSIILASALERKLLASIATMAEAYGIRLLGVLEKPMTPRKLSALIKLHKPVVAKDSAPHAGEFTLSELTSALQNDEFVPYYQPKVDLATDRVRGAEALVRWLHPRLGTLAPASFIDTMESGGLIDELTWVMLKTSASHCEAWRAAGIDATVSVNLSGQSLGNADMAERVTELVRRNLDPRHMILEVTESSATGNGGIALENLARLRMKGFGLSIDDFGTGYSSMRQLARIAFTELKIDRYFVMQANKEPTARVILESSLKVAKKLNINSVAEGVETRADFDLLSRLQCDMAQGYFVAAPMAYSGFLDWNRRWTMGGDSASN
ncbi:MAG TPA: EAL domain-containing response regulator [Casimicrobiaceae bacterium]|nr:EAL domain-containing response regulator [Casimicrobiaceae bacterium]